MNSISALSFSLNSAFTQRILRWVCPLFLMVLLTGQGAAIFAQSNLPLDETTKKICFEEIIKADSIPLSVLHSNAATWMDTHFKSKNMLNHVDAGGGFLESEGKFLVYTKGIISKEVHGAIRYKVSVDTKESKYRYKFSDFVFEYYKQNREYKYVPTGKEKPLEDAHFSGWEKPWQRYKRDTSAKINQYIASLKMAMLNNQTEPSTKPARKKEEW